MSGHRQVAPPPYQAVRYVDGVAVEKLCRWCRRPLLKPDGSPDTRRNWHPQCAEDFMVQRSSGALRAAVQRRDGGVCAACGAGSTCDIARHRDYVAAHKALTALAQLRAANHYGMGGLYWAKAVLAGMGWADRLDVRYYDAYEWDADHIVPLIDGGSKELGNVQTLCRPCHKAKTAREAAARAAARRTAQQVAAGQLTCDQVRA